MHTQMPQMRIYWIYFFCIFALCAHARANEIYLPVGERKTLNIKSVSKIKIKGRHHIQATDLGNKIIITGLSVGEAVIHSTGETYKIYVVSPLNAQFIMALRKLLVDFLDLKVLIEENKIKIVGTLHRLADLAAIHQLEREYQQKFQLSSKIDDDIKPQVVDWLRKKLQQAGHEWPLVTFENGPIAHLPEDKMTDRSLLKALSETGIDWVFEKNQLSISPLVRVKIIVAEVNKKVQSQIGVDWPEMISAKISPKFDAKNPIEIFLKALEQNGLGQILASPNLLARSGSEAEFLAGGEFAIKIISRQMRDVIWKKHGIYLKIKPKADSSGRLSVELTTEVSLIDAAQTVDGIPALKTNRMSTHFDLHQAKTIVLSGLIRNDWGKSADGVWGLSRLPVIGSLFKSENFYNNKTELVIFVTPEIVSDTEPTSTDFMPKSWSDNAITH